MILRSRLLLPMDRPAIPDGALEIQQDRILQVGSWKDLRKCSGRHIDLGDTVLLPGLINAHCHLDYTHMAGELTPGHHFTDWIQAITELKSAWSYSDFAASWIAGANMLLRHGVTTVVDIEAVPELLQDIRPLTPLSVFSCIEMTGVRTRRDPHAILADAVALIREHSTYHQPVGISPHAPYSTTSWLLELSGEVARRTPCLLTIHAAESEDEYLMFTEARGPMFDWLARNRRSMADCGLGTPVQHLARHGVLGRGTLVAHANHLGPGDAALLAHAGATVVHCPRSHAFFRHHRFPLADLATAGVLICVGTDSLGTTKRSSRALPELDLLAELQSLAAADYGLSPDVLLQLVTLNPARALGRSEHIGQLAEGAQADLALLPCPGAIETAYDAVIHHRGEVLATMTRGQWVHVKPSLQEVLAEADATDA